MEAPRSRKVTKSTEKQKQKQKNPCSDPSNKRYGAANEDFIKDEHMVAILFPNVTISQVFSSPNLTKLSGRS